MLDKEFKYYIDNQAELVKKYLGKFIVIVGESVVGDYNSLDAACEESDKIYEPGKYLVQECLPGEDNYTITYHSRAIFS